MFSEIKIIRLWDTEIYFISHDFVPRNFLSSFGSCSVTQFKTRKSIDVNILLSRDQSAEQNSYIALLTRWWNLWEGKVQKRSYMQKRRFKLLIGNAFEVLLGIKIFKRSSSQFYVNANRVYIYIRTAEVLEYVFVSCRCSNNANFVRQKVRIIQCVEKSENLSNETQSKLVV